MRSIIVAGAFLALVNPAHADQDEECPTAFQGARVVAAKVREGVQIEFRNPNRTQVQAMRVQLREVAEMIEQQSTLQQTASDDDEVEFPPVDLAVKNIALGARVTVRAARMRDIPALRELAFGFAEFWKTSACVSPLVSQR